METSRNLTERESLLVRYALKGGAAFCQNNVDVKLFCMPLFDLSGKRCGTEEIVAVFDGESEAKTVTEKIVSKQYIFQITEKLTLKMEVYP